MPWSANVTDANLSQGVMIVTVQYTDGSEIITESYKSSGVPKVDWIGKTVFKKIEALDALDDYIVPVGPVTPVDPSLPAERILWNERHSLIRTLDILIDRGIVDPQDTDVQSLKTYLTANWKTFLLGN